jgi:molecular chaperone GrpE (heat shock protein)
MPQDISSKKFPSFKTKKTVEKDPAEQTLKTNLDPGSKSVHKKPVKIRAKTSTSKVISSLEQELDTYKLQLSNKQEQLISTQKALQDKIVESDLLARQHELDIEQKIKSSKKKIIEPIITFINNLVLAFQYLPQGIDQDFSKFVETLKSTLQRTVEDLQKHGIEIIIPNIGQDVDPVYMNVLNPAVSVGQDLKVQSIVSVGVKIDGQITQPVSIMAE